MRGIKFMPVETVGIFSPEGWLFTIELDGLRMKDLGINTGDRLRASTSCRMVIFVKLLKPNTSRQTDHDPMHL